MKAIKNKERNAMRTTLPLNYILYNISNALLTTKTFHLHNFSFSELTTEFLLETKSTYL